MAGAPITTGEMIDQLKDGEVAERIFEKIGVCSDRFTKAKKDIDGELMFYNEQREQWELDRLTSSLINSKWRILPNYVSFNEAMKALKDGNRVAFHSDGKRYYVEPTESEIFRISSRNIGVFSLLDLYNGKWTIEDLYNGKWTIEDLYNGKWTIEND
ncbi:hypothetical protein [Virgibacillus proomii]|uniref:hypothetical protein n=1 Tax=Virgibacillus proomii TaxID=84407 RepID=UPI000986EAFA|nr:hypothetical protein [Virgibacillus proomii]